MRQDPLRGRPGRDRRQRQCNCSICTKLRAWGTIIKPSRFRLLAGQNDTSTYVWGAAISKRYFCRHCGVHVYGVGHLAEVGGDFCSVNLATLDVDAETLAAIPVRYFDGRNDQWETPPDCDGSSVNRGAVSS